MLSVAQLLSIGYFVIFENEGCTIKDQDTEKEMVRIQMARNNMFPLFVIDVEYVNLTVRTQHSSILWHQRYMHLNDKGLKIFKQKGLVKGLPYID